MERIMKLSLSAQCVKHLLIVINLLFVITGIILLAVGVGIHGVYHSYKHFLDDKFLSVPSLLIAIGAIIFFIAIFGFCGPARESYCMLVTFTALLVIVFILELAGGISGYVLRARASAIIENKMHDSMMLYENSTEIKNIWDKMQIEFDCCGTDDPKEWTSILNGTIPDSCCSGAENCTLTSTNLHNVGCYTSFVSFIKSHALQLGGVGIGLALFQVLVIWCSTYLARSLTNSYEYI